MKFLKNFFAERALTQLEEKVEQINALEAEFQGLSDEGLKEKSAALRARLQDDETLDDIIPDAFALAREAAKRTLGQRPFDSQILGGLAIHNGAVSEMGTGEGKTLAAVAPAYLNALSGKGVHVVTVNEYLARRDAVWMGQIYHALGLKVSCLVPNGAFAYDPEWHIQKNEADEIDKERDTTGVFLVQQEYLKPISRREAYEADITYGTNHEFGFDYLRDNLAYKTEDQAQSRAHYFAVIDEVDSILIDEARTPLIIAAPDAAASDFYKLFARVAGGLNPPQDYVVDEKKRSVTITEEGIEKVEKMIGVANLYAPENIRLVHYLEESLRAKALFMRDRDYVVKNGEVIIVDEFTGRLLQGRRYHAGLHQAIEAKESVHVKEESRTYAKISIQNYFRLYEKIAGMTGTAQTSAEEFHKVYHLEVISIPPNKPLARKDHSDVVYKTNKAKWDAVVKEIEDCYRRGQPVLVGTTSIEKNEHLSGLLKRAGIPHEVLNAKNNEREGAIIAQAGKLKAVTVATNMAGRGVDIILGGNPFNAEEAEKVRELGGLHVIGTERHEARRIDNQLRGRAGRQGDPGSSRFFISLEDDLMRIFGGDQIRGLMDRFNLPDDEPIEMGMVSKAVAQAQSKVEGANFDMRKHLLEYDDVLNKQRSGFYKRRKEFLAIQDPQAIAHIIYESSSAYFDRVLEQKNAQFEGEEEQKINLKAIFMESGIIHNDDEWQGEDEEALRGLIKKRSEEVAQDPQAKNRLLGILDLLWMNHLEDLEALNESVGLRAYGQRDPLVEYRNESHKLFKNFWGNFDGWIFANMFKLGHSHGKGQAANSQPIAAGNRAVSSDGSKVGRNDPCPCGSGKKFKKCHGR